MRGTKLASRKRFSRFLTWTLVLLEGVSLTLVVGILYGILSRSMTQEFYQKLRVQEAEVNMALHDRLNLLETQLRDMSLNNTVRVSLMLGVKSQLLEILEGQYPSSNGSLFLVQEEEGSAFIPALPEGLSALEPHLRKLQHEKDLQKIEFQDFGDGQILSLFSLPIKRRVDRLGTAYLLYDISQDTRFWERFSMNDDKKLFLQKSGHLVDLRTGQSLPLPTGTQDLTAKGLDLPGVDLFPDESLITLKNFPQLLYATSSVSLQEKKSSLIFMLVLLCVAVFLLTLLASCLIARKMSEPLESMADQALEIAREPSGRFLREEEIRYTEFHKLAQAFNKVLVSLLDTQGKLKKRAGELDASEKRYRCLVQTSPTGILSTDMQWKIDFANRTLEEITGYTQADLSSMELWDMVPAEERDRKRQTGENHLRRPTQEMWEACWVRKDGQPIWVGLQATPIETKAGEPAILVNVMDITEQKRAEEEKKELEAQLQQARKMEAIGTLAGGIAHEFNNFLFPIIGYVDMAICHLPEDSIVCRNLKEVLKAANRAKEMVQQILAFSRRSEPERKPMKIQPVIKETLRMLRVLLPSTIEINQNIDKECGTVLADQSQIYQMIMNLGTNAYHAMSDKGGVLGVTMTEVNIDSGDFTSNLAISPGAYLKLTVSDTGHGMDRTVMERIFDPYFTTKRPGEGTGMGLSVVHGIVRGHGGHVTVYSEPGKGTTFCIYLPRIDTVIVTPETVLAGPIPKGKERILLVDDEEQIILSARQMLEDLGYDVTSRTNSVEALELFVRQPDKFDLVMTDQAMPNMTGAELAKRLIGIRPETPIILFTGFSEVISEDKARAIGIREYVMKPVVMRDLAETIRKALDKNRG